MSSTEADIEDIIQRVAAQCREAASLSVIDCLGCKLDKLPYMAVGLGPMTFGSDPDEFASDAYDIRIRLIVGQLTQGYDGTAERLLRQYIKPIRKYFARHTDLTVVATPSGYLTSPAYLSWQPTALTGGVGTVYFNEPSIGQQVGTEFTLRIYVKYII